MLNHHDPSSEVGRVEPRRRRTQRQLSPLELLGWLVGAGGAILRSPPALAIGAVFVACGRWGHRLQLSWLPLSPGWLAVSVAWPALLLYGIALEHKLPDIGSIMGIVAVGLVPALLGFVVTRLKQWDKRESGKVHEAIRRLLPTGVAPYIHLESRSGIALDPVNRVVVLGGATGARRYGYDDVRSFEAVHETPDKITSAESAQMGVLVAGSINAKAARQANANTGLYLRVRDVTMPRWRIEMPKAEDQYRWSEILTQELRDARREDGRQDESDLRAPGA